MKDKAKLTIFPLLAATLLVSGCASIGPAKVTRDRFNYVASISESWKQQMLLNPYDFLHRRITTESLYLAMLLDSGH